MQDASHDKLHINVAQQCSSHNSEVMHQWVTSYNWQRTRKAWNTIIITCIKAWSKRSLTVNTVLRHNYGFFSLNSCWTNDGSCTFNISNNTAARNSWSLSTASTGMSAEDRKFIWWLLIKLSANIELSKIMISVINSLLNWDKVDPFYNWRAWNSHLTWRLYVFRALVENTIKSCGIHF